MDSTTLMLLLACVLLFGGQIKIGDQTLLQLLMSLIGGIFKPTPTPTATNTGQFGGFLDIFKGLLSNPMVLIAIMVGVMMLTGGGGCGMSGCSLIPTSDTPPVTSPLEVTPAIWDAPTPSYSGSHYADVQRLHLIRISSQVNAQQNVEPWHLYPEPANLPPNFHGQSQPAAIPLTCYGGTCSRPQTIRSTPLYRTQTGFWQRGPVRRLIASAPLRRLQPLRRLSRGLRWIFRGR